jgi:tetratricopeptide (TPR) repeat protein
LGDAVAAEHAVRAAYDALPNPNFNPWAAGVLAEILYKQERYDEAQEFGARARRAARKGVPLDLYGEVSLRQLEAKLLATRGEHAAAQRRARAAVELGRPTEWLSLRAKSLIGLAEVLCLGDRPIEAEALLKEALQLCELKGNVLLEGKARALLPELRSGREPALSGR